MTKHTKGWTLAWGIIDLVLGLGMITAGILSGIIYVLVLYIFLGLIFGISSMRHFVIYREKRYLSLKEKYEEIINE